ncbi:MAG: glycosyltransferase family 2 protein, partial [Quinella sp. 2Q5]|nr:glycosyltransferase family 2 protein [Quinella sp. 2Q5]
MANIPAVSVVVPLFNAERYVAACLESLLYQTLTDFEVIVVDDCSTDSSVAVVESYIPKFGGRLKLSRMKKNSGSGGLPRNKGLQHSRGEYIFFVDADDFVTPTALEELYTLAKNFDADVVYCEKIFDTDAAATNVWLTNMNGKFSVAAPTFVTENLAERVHEILQLRFCVETVL